MEPKHGSKNCKQSSTTFQLQSGILTRSKCQTYLLSQFDASCPKDLQVGLLHSPCKKPKRQSNEYPSRNEDVVSHLIIKDLRTKRVYSPNLTNESRFPVPSGEQVSNRDGVIIANASCPNGDEVVRKSFEETAEVRNVVVCNSNSCLVNGYVGFGEEDQRRNEVSEPVDGKREELTHSTRPEAEILARDCQGVSSDGCPRPSNGYVKGGSYTNVESRNDSLSKTRLVLKPCFKRKLFKAPGSIAYKRLLPYLLDNDACTLQDDPYPKREKNLEKNVNIESNICNCPREPSSVDSDTCTKNVISSSGMSLNSVKLGLPPQDEIMSFVEPLGNGSTEKFQNGNPCGNPKYIDSNNDLTLVTEGSDLKKDNVICASSDDKGMIENGGHTKSQIKHLSDKAPSKTSGLKKLDGGNSSISSNFSSEVVNSKLCVSKKSSNIVWKNIKRKDDYGEESLPMTSLNSDISDKPVTKDRRGEKVDCTQGADHVSQNHGNIVVASDKKYDSYPRDKSIRNPLLQLKLFSSQGSISYRRMLPFLEELMKDNSEYSCALGNIDFPRLEKGLETMHSQPPSSNFHNSPDKSKSFSSYIKPSEGNSNTLSRTVLTITNQTVCETEKNLMSSGVHDDLQTPKLEKQQQLHSELEMLDECKLETDPRLHSAVLLNDQAVISLYPGANYESLTEEESRLISKQSPITSEECKRLTASVSDAKLPGTNSSQWNSSCLEACVPPENPINVRKGILKRNPRGCRGICSCLNCSSFRLHAERGFEFSRNQLQDAEELALDLMKELSCLRDVLEKSANAANVNAEYHLHKVKEVCRKASEAESIAKDRLAQMNYELDIHCRITCSQRPNVRFSGDIEKRN